jgi:uncharacterized protein YciW
VDRLVQLLHASVGRVLLNRHRLTLLMHLAQALHPAAFPPEEWQLLLGSTAVAAADAAGLAMVFTGMRHFRH